MIQRTITERLHLGLGGVVNHGDEVVVYDAYYPKSGPIDCTYKVGRVSPRGKVAWSGAPRRGETSGWRVGHVYEHLDQYAYPYLVTVGDRMRLGDGSGVAVSYADRTRPAWAIVSRNKGPYPADVGRGPRGGYFVRPDYAPLALLRRTSFDPEPLYEVRMTLLSGPPDRVIVRRGADGELYVFQGVPLMGTFNFFSFPRAAVGRAEGDGWGGCHLSMTGYEDVLDFDVSPCGTKLAVACISRVPYDLEAGLADKFSADALASLMEHNPKYGRLLRMYAIHSPTDVRPVADYVWPCHYVSFSPDGLTLAMLGNDKSLRGYPLDTLTIVDVD